VSRYSILGVHFIIYIKLNFLDSRSKLHYSFVESLHGDNFKRPFLQNWKFFIIVVKQWDDENTHSVIAILQATFKRVKYSYIVNVIQKSLSVPWAVRFNNETLKLSAKLNKHVVYFESGILLNSTIKTLRPASGEIPNTLDKLKRNPHHFMLRQDWTYLKKDMRDHQGGVVITKMYFCNLIELETSEYTDNLNEITVTATNKTLATGEYVKVLGKDGDTRVRICLEDMYPPENMALRRHQPCIVLFVVCVTIMSFFIC